MSTKETLETNFPGLTTSQYEITSPEDPGYNCIAWAAADRQRWWEPDPMGTCYWPKTVSRVYSLAAYATLYASLGYEPCDNDRYEEGFEKIALFAKGDRPTHAARQVAPEIWTSKLGRHVDIGHQLRSLSGQNYGSVVLIMKRAMIGKTAEQIPDL